MADIVFRYPEMRQAASQLRDLAQQYTSAANKFEEGFTSSVSAWEGESKEKMISFITGPVREYTADTVPKLINALADILDANADQMEAADQQISDNIPASLG